MKRSFWRSKPRPASSAKLWSKARRSSLSQNCWLLLNSPSPKMQAPAGKDHAARRGEILRQITIHGTALHSSKEQARDQKDGAPAASCATAWPATPDADTAWQTLGQDRWQFRHAQWPWQYPWIAPSTKPSGSARRHSFHRAIKVSGIADALPLLG